jgi:hypothetical protein
MWVELCRIEPPGEGEGGVFMHELWQGITWFYRVVAVVDAMVFG